MHALCLAQDLGLDCARAVRPGPPVDALALVERSLFARNTFTSSRAWFIVLTDEFEDEDESEKKEVVEEDSSQSIGDMPADKLSELLNQALEEEDYEKAAKIRDELNRRN